MRGRPRRRILRACCRSADVIRYRPAGCPGWGRPRRRPVTTDQILLGVGLILVLAVGSQVLASRLRIPALIILLPAGFIAGALTTDVDPQRLLGTAFQPLVSLAAAVILYDAGLALDVRKLRGHTRPVVSRPIVPLVPVPPPFRPPL